MKVTLLIPTLNEIEGMRVIMPRIKREWYDQLIVVDGNSTDGTTEYARERGYTVIVQKKKGFRYAFEESFPYIEGEIVITFSPDGNSIPELIPPLIEKMKEGYDMVIVSRYADGATSEDDNLLTGFGNWMFTKLINLLHGGSYTDTLVIFRAFKKELFTTLDLLEDASFRSEKFFLTKLCVEPLLSIRCAKRKLKVCDIPGDEPKRIGGKSKLQPFRWGGAIFLQIIRELYYWK
jgi:glycosyltransferase involved in cell wall biosynthesis